MHTALISHIDGKIYEASRFVCQYMPLDISIDNAYEALLGCSNSSAVMITAFREAVKFLPPTANHKQFNIMVSDGRMANVQIRFTPTDKWPAFLFPEGDLRINPEGYFAALLETPVRVATEWESLDYIWKTLRSGNFSLEPYVLAYLMPWIRECLADFEPLNIAIETTRTERRVIDKELSMIMNDWNVTFFPRLSKQLLAIARSGRHLFAQYNMIESAYTRDNLTQSPVTITRTPSLVEPWVREQMTEVHDDWLNDKLERVKRRMDEGMIRDNKNINPRGK